MCACRQHLRDLLDVVADNDDNDFESAILNDNDDDVDLFIEDIGGFVRNDTDLDNFCESVGVHEEVITASTRSADGPTFQVCACSVRCVQFT